MTSTPRPPSSRFTAAQWRDAVQGAATEIARNMLSLPGAVIGEPGALAQTKDMIGAHIPIVGAQAFELSLFSTRAGCAALATAVLGMNAEELPPGTIPDAIGEIVNMLSGGVKRRLSGLGGDLELGLPVFVNGNVELANRQSALVLPVQFGPISAVIVIIGVGLGGAAAPAR